MNILMINGTMRKGSTYRIAKMFVERVTLSQDTVNELFLPKDMPEFCRGCGQCITQGAKKCPDYIIYLKRITRLIDEADLLVFATPTYVYHTTGQMKALLDHYGYRWMVHRPEASMFKKQAVCFSTAAGAGMKNALKDITDSLKWWGVGRIYTYGAAVRSMDWDEIGKPVKDKIDENVNKLMAKIVHERDKVTPSLYERVLFYAMRYMHSRTFMQQIDTDYWREAGWLGSKRPWIMERAEIQPEQQAGKADVQGKQQSQEWTDGQGKPRLQERPGGQGKPRPQEWLDGQGKRQVQGQPGVQEHYGSYGPAGQMNENEHMRGEFAQTQDYGPAAEDTLPQEYAQERQESFANKALMTGDRPD